jgi:ATP-dependent Zn protease
MTTRRPKTRQPVAYHEAGHAVTALTLGIRLRRKGATIIPDEGAYGMVWTQLSFRGRPDEEVTDRMHVRLEREIVVFLAGEHAQREYRSSSVRSYHGDSDRRKAVDLLGYLVPDMSSEEFTLHYKLLSLRAKNMVKAHWPQISAVANALLERKTLTADEITELVYPGMRAAVMALQRQ